MISDVLAALARLRREIPDDEFDAELALEAAVESVDREVTDDELELLDGMLPEWLDGETAQGGEAT